MEERVTDIGQPKLSGISIDKTIGILADEAFNGCITFNKDWKDAVKLGIEALKAVKDSRRRMGIRGVPQLPGETKE